MITTQKVKAAEVRAVKKKIQKILHKILSKKTIFLHIFILKPNEEEQEIEQFDMDMVVAEEYIEYYADKYKKLIRKHKFAMPLCKHTDKNKLYNAIETTSNIPAGYYITVDVLKMLKNLVTKIVLSIQTKLLLRLSCMILNIFNRYLSYTFFIE